MKKPLLTRRTWLGLLALWAAETVLWIVAYFVAFRVIGKVSAPPNYPALALLFFTFIAIQAQLLRPVWFALSTVAVRRIEFLTARSGLMLCHISALLVTLALSWFWPPERVFFIQRGGLPSTFWFIVMAGIVTSTLWLFIEKKEPVQPPEPAPGSDT